jgi:branched-chain amino acid transport system permease protein
MQWYEQFAQILLIGIANGSLVALVALGYTLVYGIIELINFAHGDVFMIGTMLALTIVTWVPRLIGVNQPYLMSAPMILLTLILSLLASMIVCGLMNVTIERLAYRPLRQAPRLAPLISAIGVSFILINIGLHWKGASPLDFPNLFPNIDVFRDVLKVTTPVAFHIKDAFVIAVALPLAYGLNLFVQRTRLGKAMRATAQDPEAARMMGIDVDRIIVTAFFLGSALAGAAALIFGLYYNYTSFIIGYTAGLRAFTAAVLGGIGSVTGAMVGGVLIGLVEALGGQIFEVRWTDVIIFSILVLVLVFAPNGLFGRPSATRS